MQTENTRKKPSSNTASSARAARRPQPQQPVAKRQADVQDAAYYRAMADGYFSFWFNDA